MRFHFFNIKARIIEQVLNFFIVKITSVKWKGTDFLENEKLRIFLVALTLFLTMFYKDLSSRPENILLSYNIPFSHSIIYFILLNSFNLHK